MIRGLMLGPQRLHPTVHEAADALALDGPLAAITAGWQERESEHGELEAALGRPLVNLSLYARVEAVFAADPELFSAHRAKQDQLRQLQILYRLRLRHSLRALRRLIAMEGAAELVQPEVEAALDDLQRLDAHHLGRLETLQRDFEARYETARRPALTRQREAIGRQLEDCRGVVIAGGHVAALLNRLRLLELGAALAQSPLIAWSAGAMVLSDRIVLFHDAPPQGAGDAELLGQGLGLWPGVVPLPHGRSRLDLEDRARVGLFARRFAPAACIVLEPKTRLDFDGRGWHAHSGAAQLLSSGLVEPMTP